MIKSGIARWVLIVHRWTAKEAGYKALYPNIKGTWKDATVSKIDGKPRLDSIYDVQLHLSVSQDGEYMTAFVVAEDRT